MIYLHLLRARILRSHHSFLAAVGLSAGNHARYRYHRDKAQKWDEEVAYLAIHLMY